MAGGKWVVGQKMRSCFGEGYDANIEELDAG
jgi:hypothetical protein